MKYSLRHSVPFVLALVAMTPAVAKKATPLPKLPAPVAAPKATATPIHTVAVPAISSQANETVIYDGAAGSKSGLTLSTWGGGSVEDSGEMGYGKGGHAVKVTTHGLYQGARIAFNNPIDLSDRSDSRYLLLQIRFSETGTTTDDDSSASLPTSDRPLASLAGFATADYDQAGSGLLHLAQAAPPFGFPGGGYPGAPGGRRGGRGGRGGRPGGPPGYPGGGYPGYPGVRNPYNRGGEEAAWVPPFKTVRLLFTLANGAEFDITRPVPLSTNDDQDIESAWLPISIPMSAFKFPAGSENSPLASITIGGDGNGSFYVGHIGMITDTAPISVSPMDTQDVAAGDPVSLQGHASGGVTDLKFSWDFDSSDGITEDSTGPIVSHTFAKGNRSYTVTLTVSDVNGIKKPVTVTVPIKVED